MPLKYGIISAAEFLERYWAKAPYDTPQPALPTLATIRADYKQRTGYAIPGSEMVESLRRAGLEPEYTFRGNLWPILPREDIPSWSVSQWLSDRCSTMDLPPTWTSGLQGVPGHPQKTWPGLDVLYPAYVRYCADRRWTPADRLTFSRQLRTKLGRVTIIDSKMRFPVVLHDEDVE